MHEVQVGQSLAPLQRSNTFFVRKRKIINFCEKREKFSPKEHCLYIAIKYDSCCVRVYGMSVSGQPSLAKLLSSWVRCRMIHFNFISHNVKGLGDRAKRKRQFKYLQDQVRNKGIIYFQETHSATATQTKWIEEFGKKNKLLFSHGKSNARGVAIGFVGNLDYTLIKTEADSDGRFIIIEAKMKNDIYVFINFYNENVEANQLKLFEKLENSLKKNWFSQETLTCSSTLSSKLRAAHQNWKRAPLPKL